MYKSSTASTKLASLRYLAKHCGMEPKCNRLQGFAEACFNDCSVDELITSLTLKAADKTDCDAWGITPSQWRNAIHQALENRIFYAIEDIEH